jgi:chaperone modulatory protein CbpM
MIEKISREELVKIYNVEITFFDSLEEAGLLQTETENEVKYVLYEELTVFEKLTNLHYDLEVNLPGLEVIKHLLTKIEKLQQENLHLRF